MENNIDLINDTKRGFWLLSGPFLILSFFEAIYSLIDMFWISQMSQAAFFAIGIGLPFFAFINNLGKSVGLGTLSIISREIGAGNYENSQDSLWHGIIVCCVLAVILILAIMFLSDILAVMGVTESVSLVKQFMIPILLFSPVFLFSNFFVYTLQAEGNSRIPTILLILSSILNLILDPILIFTLNWGISGAAFASILSSAAMTVYLLYWYLSGRSSVALSVNSFKPRMIYDILIVAVPSFLMDLLMCLVTSFVNVIMLKQLGQIGVVLYSAASKVKELILAPKRAYGKSMMTVSGQLYGAGKIDKLKSIIRYVAMVSTVTTLVLSVAFFFIRVYAFEWFSVTGVETYVYYIAFVGIFILLEMQFSSLGERVLSGLGKTCDSLFINGGTSILKFFLITALAPVLTSGAGVLVGILVSEACSALVYYIVLKIIFRRLEKKMDPQGV